jgi:S-adenosylmethionine:tRNA ribosyltransferase-isomerase
LKYEDAVKTELFDFTLPESLIASRPVTPRHASRMLVVEGAAKDAWIADLPRYLKPGDVMVFNDTKVIPARLYGRRGDVQVEILLHKRLMAEAGENRHYFWTCFAKPAKRLRAGDVVVFNDQFQATVHEKLDTGEVVLRFDEQGFWDHLQNCGQMPLPPYIERQRSKAGGKLPAGSTAMSQSHCEGQQAEAGDDLQDYQTVYAKHAGSVAAPTAGLHFSEELLATIDAMGVRRAHVTLHVGGGTFLPVKVDDTRDHIMHSEYAVVDEQTAQLINDAKAKGGRVIAVGTTSLRTLESATDETGALHPFAQETSIFITPGYRFRMVDVLMTNFHLPRSTLFMLVSAFCGLEVMQAAYKHAIANRYRFYSYGDACLLFPAKG